MKVDTKHSLKYLIKSVVDMRNELLLCLIFITYGPSIKIIGEFRIPEIILIFLTIFNFQRIRLNIGYPQIIVVCMSLFTALVYVIFDFYNHGIEVTTIKKVGTYFLLGLNFLIIFWLCQNRMTALLACMLGFYLSFFVVYFFQIPTPSKYFLDTPWQLGVGKAVTVLFFIMIALFPKQKKLLLSTSLILIFFHIQIGSRHLFLITSLAIMLSYFAFIFGKTKIEKISSRKIFYLSGLISTSLVVVFLFFTSFMNLNFANEKFKFKHTTQKDSHYGLLINSRPEFFAALIGISKKPLTGYGTNTIDPVVVENYAQFAAAGNEIIYNDIITEKWHKIIATPSHSVILGTWIDAGFFATLMWFLGLILLFNYLTKVTFLNHSFAPLLAFTILITMWDILFSPGPNRIEIVLNFVLLIYFFKPAEKRENGPLK